MSNTHYDQSLAKIKDSLAKLEERVRQVELAAKAVSIEADAALETARTAFSKKVESYEAAQVEQKAYYTAYQLAQIKAVESATILSAARKNDRLDVGIFAESFDVKALAEAAAASAAAARAAKAKYDDTSHQDYLAKCVDEAATQAAAASAAVAQATVANKAVILATSALERARANELDCSEPFIEAFNAEGMAKRAVKRAQVILQMAASSASSKDGFFSTPVKLLCGTAATLSAGSIASGVLAGLAITASITSPVAIALGVAAALAITMLIVLAIKEHLAKINNQTSETTSPPAPAH